MRLKTAVSLAYFAAVPVMKSKTIQKPFSSKQSYAISSSLYKGQFKSPANYRAEQKDFWFSTYLCE